MAVAGALWAAAAPAAARFETMEAVALDGLRSRRVVVRLPPEYDTEPSRRFPVLYVHDGQWAWREGYQIDRALDALTRARRVEPHIVVAVDNTSDRRAEYAGAARTRGPSLERYADLLARVVKPRVDATYRTRAGRADTAVIGYSLGALASLFLARWHGDVFGRIGVCSPVIWRRREGALAALRRGRLPVRMWIDVGTAELPSSRAGSAAMVVDARALRRIAISRGMREGEDLGYREVAGARHGEAELGARIDEVLAFLLDPASAPRRARAIDRESGD